MDFIQEKMYIQVDRSERTVRVLGMSYLLDCDFIYDLFSEVCRPFQIRFYSVNALFLDNDRNRL